MTVKKTIQIYDPITGKYREITQEIDCYRHPSLDREYIKQLLEVENHPNCTKKSVLWTLYGKIKNFDTFDDLVDKQMIKVTGTGKYRASLYSITPNGYALLSKVINVPEHLQESIDKMIQLSKDCASLEELDIKCSLIGNHSEYERFTSKEFIDSLYSLDFNGSDTFKRIFMRYVKSFYPFYDEILKRHSASAPQI